MIDLLITLTRTVTSHIHGAEGDSELALFGGLTVLRSHHLFVDKNGYFIYD